MDQIWPSWTSSGPHGPALALMDQLWPSWTSSGPHGPALAGPDGTTLARMELFLPAGAVQVRMDLLRPGWNYPGPGWSPSGLNGPAMTRKELLWLGWSSSGPARTALVHVEPLWPWLGPHWP
jgi:hypothetical protein